MKIKILFFSLLLLSVSYLSAEETVENEVKEKKVRVKKSKPTDRDGLGGVAEYTGYDGIYDLIDELGQERIIRLNSAVKPYDRDMIANWLVQAAKQDSLLTNRQRKEVQFYLNDFALELDTLPDAIFNWTNKKTFSVAALQPAYHYKDEWFKCKMNPILGMEITTNSHGTQTHRWYGAEFRATIIDHIAIWGSLRDHSYSGEYLNDDYFESIGVSKRTGAQLTKSGYMNKEMGVQYKEATYGGDYSEIRAGIKLYDWWGSIGLVKENLQWGDSYTSSLILSGRAPSFPMLELKLKPCKWFQFDYIHASLVSNVIDSTSYFIEENYTDSTSKTHYRPASKFLAANLFTFTPIKGLNLSIGNSIVYGESTIQAAYLIPIAFYKSLDHQLTKGLSTENQNSQLFAQISSRNIKHLHLFAQVFIDEISWSRFLPSSEDRNPIGWKVGGRLSNFPLDNLILTAEFTQTNIATYEHSIERITWTSNSYYLGHYLGSNARELYLSLSYKPIRGLLFDLSYTGAFKYNEYDYIRKDIIEIISQPAFDDLVWRNDEVKLHTRYEVVHNAYATVDLTWNNAQGFDVEGDANVGENRLDAAGYLAKYTPAFYWGSNVTFKCGFSFYF
ncbi:MAG: capsule assembly Wzi family protein [bacterium]